MPFDDFMPDMVKMSYDVKVREDVAVRMNLPQSRRVYQWIFIKQRMDKWKISIMLTLIRVGSAIYSSLVNHAPEMNARSSRFGRTTSKKTVWYRLHWCTHIYWLKEWLELWRTEGVDVNIEYAYHPIMGAFTSEVKLRVVLLINQIYLVTRWHCWCMVTEEGYSSLQFDTRSGPHQC